MARYAPPGVNQQPVHPPFPGMMPDRLIAACEQGMDPICRGAPYRLIAAVREGQGSSQVDGIIPVTYANATAPVFGVGHLLGRIPFLGGDGVVPATIGFGHIGRVQLRGAPMCGYPRFQRRTPRNTLKVTWR